MSMTLAGGDIHGTVWLTGKDLKGGDLYMEISNNLFTVIGENYQRSHMPTKVMLMYMEEREELSVDLISGVK